MQNKKIEGVVKKGQRLGSTYGFPTANISVNEKLEPGIYAGKVTLPSGEWNAALYVSSDKPDLLESHLIGYIGDDFYGENIAITVDKKIRDEIKDLSDERLIQLIESDVKEIIRHFSHPQA